MNKDIKEIIDRLKYCKEHDEEDNYYPEDIFFKDDSYILLDYITNLQEKLKVSQTNKETYRLEMQDITKILGLDEHTTFDEVKEYATNLQENKMLRGNTDIVNLELIEYKNELEDKITNLQERINKVIELIEPLVEWGECTINGKILKQVFDILQGEKGE